MYLSTVKFLLKLDNISLYDSISQINMLVEGDDENVEISSDDGYLMKNNQYVYSHGPSGSGFSFGISSAFSVGFWIYPVYPGMVTDPVSGDPAPITMSVVDFVSGSTSIIYITEVSTENETHKLKVSFNDGAYSATTDTEYSPSLWHYFWITYSGTNLYVYVDGISSTLSVSGILPATLSGSLIDVYLNHSYNGYAYDAGKNTGYIKELVVFDTNITTDSSIQKIINSGLDFVADDTYTSLSRFLSAIYVNDPSMITISSAVDDMNYIYLGRNDGKILRGSPLLWEVRKTYSNADEADALDLSTETTNNETGAEPDTNTPPENRVEGGFLKLVNTIIRL